MPRVTAICSRRKIQILLFCRFLTGCGRNDRKLWTKWCPCLETSPFPSWAWARPTRRFWPTACPSCFILRPQSSLTRRWNWPSAWTSWGRSELYSCATRCWNWRSVVQLCHKMLKLEVSCTVVPQDVETGGQLYSCATRCWNWRSVVQLCYKMLKLEVSSCSVSCTGIYENSATRNSILSLQVRQIHSESVGPGLIFCCLRWTTVSRPGFDIFATTRTDGQWTRPTLWTLTVVSGSRAGGVEKPVRESDHSSPSHA